METVDIVLLVFLAIGAYRGYQTGLLMQLLGIIAFFLAIIGGFYLMYWGVDLLSDQISGYEAILPVVSFILIFFLILLAVNLVGKGLKAILNLTILGGLDNLFGALAGLFKWALMISIFIWLAGSFGNVSMDRYYENTSVFPLVASLAPHLLEALSAVLPYLKDFSHNTDDLQQAFYQ